MISVIQDKKQAIIYLLMAVVGIGAFIPTYFAQYLPLILYALTVYGVATFIIVARLIDYTLNRMFSNHEEGMN